MLFALVCAASTLSAASASAVLLPNRRAGAATKVLIGNDDGWAEGNVRAFYSTLKEGGWDAIISAPTENKSGTGSSSTTPTPLTSEGQYGTIPKGAAAIGVDSADDHIWYVNAYPVDGIKFGLSNLTKSLFSGNPTLVATGPNVGSNLGVETLFSGTVGIPAVAFSGADETRKSYKDLKDGDVSSIYAEGAVKFLSALVDAGAPYLPANVILNVNFPKAGDGTDCKSAKDFKFVQSRVYWHLSLPIDVETCDNGGVLPTESSVVGTDGCYVSVSAMKTSNKLDASKPDQSTVNNKLAGILTCLP
ncbi:5'/3'-nucleotidase sure family protein [Flagelloscypha sp. PMI_526]|nr:5'/3'-nucleotidase sure family protein [Flagelloscypha sp. PMI_526]